MQNFMDSKIDATVVLLGTQVENGSIHILLIDEKFGFEDEDGILHNHCSLTLFYKRNGSFVTGRDLTDVFLAKKTSRWSVMSTKDFHLFYKDNICSRFEVEDPFMQQIAYQIMSQAGIISVPNEEMQNNLNAILNNRYSSSE
ncbi:hypothetical protein GCK72_020207 [Caenorhabditis remanei]|uniref:Uncharacterized protein n=2 Tax=Caenorhabditis remanei TaxID=31234 RepID=A0A6A5GEW4_CAERE|nr:hypothetical protein GCK72_020207 [Caenorhabditis remanei]KAF1753650.1 hypothetical protein GCK72_020207 [Caenorhabditis remanei]